jgi:hypothetical protein
MQPRLAGILLVVFVAGCAAVPRGLPSKFYSYWRPGSDSTGLNGTSTSYFVELFSKRGPHGEFHESSEKDFYHACLGDISAFHGFLRSNERGGIGAIGEGWDVEMAILILKYGDDKLYGALRTEKAEFRESVGVALEAYLKPEDRALYPKTRTLYRYRYRPNQALERTTDRREKKLRC